MRATLSVLFCLAVGHALAQDPGIWDPTLKDMGQKAEIEGSLLYAGEQKGILVAVLSLPSRMGVKQMYGFQTDDPAVKRITPGSRVRMGGTFMKRQFDKEKNAAVYAFVDGRLLSGDPAPSSPAQSVDFAGGAESPAAPSSPAPSQEAPPKFDDTLKGWRFNGVVRTRDGLTAVFSSESGTRYVQPGMQLIEGVKVTGIKSDLVSVNVEGATFDLAPW